MTVLLFGPAREAAGAGRVGVSVEGSAAAGSVTAGAVVDALARTYPDLAPLLPRARVAVNHAYADSATVIGPDDEIAIVPPVGGG